MSFELRDHTADVAIEAEGASLGEAFAATADGMAAAMCETVPDAGTRNDISVRAYGPEALLFDYLDELIYRRDVDSVLPVDNDAHLNEAQTEGRVTWTLEGSYRAVPLSLLDAREIKAVTYSEMEIEETGTGWRVHVVLDV